MFALTKHQNPILPFLLGFFVSYFGTSFLIHAANPVYVPLEVGCEGDINCQVCTNCQYCKHCRGGGYCGVCKPPRKIKKEKTSTDESNTPAVPSNPTGGSPPVKFSRFPPSQTDLSDGESKELLSALLKRNEWILGQGKVTGWFVRLERGMVTLVTPQGNLVAIPYSSLSAQSQKIASQFEEKMIRYYKKFGKFENVSGGWDNKSYRSKIAFYDDRLWSQTGYDSPFKIFFLYLGHSDKHIEFFNPTNKDHLMIEDTSLKVNGKKGWTGIGNGEWKNNL